MISDKRIPLTENSRAYYFGKQKIIVILNPRELIVRESGTHRITDEIGMLWVIPTGWIAIEIDNGGKDWDV